MNTELGIDMANVSVSGRKGDNELGGNSRGISSISKQRKHLGFPRGETKARDEHRIAPSALAC